MGISKPLQEMILSSSDEEAYINTSGQKNQNDVNIMNDEDDEEEDDEDEDEDDMM